MLTPDNARDHRRHAEALRLSTYDHNAAALVAYLRALADRIEAGAADHADVDRLHREAHLLSRCLPPEMPTHPPDPRHPTRDNG